MPNSPLRSAPWNDEAEIRQWFMALEDKEKQKVLIELYVAIGDLRPALFDESPTVAEVLVPGLIKLLRNAGLSVIAEQAQAIMQQPGIDAKPKQT